MLYDHHDKGQCQGKQVSGGSLDLVPLFVAETGLLFDLGKSFHADDGHESVCCEQKVVLEVSTNFAENYGVRLDVTQLVDTQNGKGQKHHKRKMPQQPCPMIQKLGKASVDQNCG